MQLSLTPQRRKIGFHASLTTDWVRKVTFPPKVNPVWAAIIEYGDGRERETLSGGARRTTNNRMELIGPIKALEHLLLKGDAEAKITVISDSQYFVKGFREWMPNWARNNWMRGVDEPVKNADLWKLLWQLKGQMDVWIKHIKGHADDPLNNECDAIAVRERELSGLDLIVEREVQKGGAERDQ